MFADEDLIEHLHSTVSPAGEHFVPCMICHIKGTGTQNKNIWEYWECMWTGKKD